MIKKILLLVLIIPLLLLCGFQKKERPFIILSSGSINKLNMQRTERAFSVGQRINYALVFPDGLKYSGVRMQISSQDDKTANWGFSVKEARDLYIDKSPGAYKDYIVIKKPGRYILQFFYLNKKNYPFAHKEFLAV